MKRAAIAIAITVGVFILGGIIQIFSVETTVIIALAAGALYIAVSWPRNPVPPPLPRDLAEIEKAPAATEPPELEKGKEG